MSSQKKKFYFKGKQILLLGLVALVISAGYYRWTVEQDKLMSAVPTAGEVTPVNGDKGEDDKGEDDKGEDRAEDNTSQNQEGVSDGEITKLKQERDRARSQSADEWKKVSQSSESSADTRKEAEKKLLDATKNAEAERNIETQVIAKGFDDCIAYVDDGGVSVTVKGGEVDGSKVAQIKDVIVAETNIAVKNIKINAM